VTFSLPGCIVTLVLLILAPIAFSFWQGWNEPAAKRPQTAFSRATGSRPAPMPTAPAARTVSVEPQHPSSPERAASSDHLLSGVVIGVGLAAATYLCGLLAVGLVVLVGMIRFQPVTTSGHERDAIMISTLMIGVPVIWILSTLALGYAGAAAARRGGRSAGFAAAAVVATFLFLPSLALGGYGLLAIAAGIAPTFLAMSAGAFLATRHSAPTVLDAAVAESVRTASAGAASVIGLFSGGSDSPVAAQFKTAWGIDDVDRAGLPHPGVWQAIDADRRKVLFLVASPFVFLGLYLLLTTWRSPSAICGSLPLVIMMGLAVLAVTYASAQRRERESRRPVSVVAAELLPESTRDALAAVRIAAGEPELEAAFFDDSAINAYFMRREGEALRLSVSRGFTGLPQSEQRAGLAMLVGRSRVNTSFRAMDVTLLVQHPGHSDSGGVDGRLLGDASPQELVARQWLDVAKAGDAQALLLLKDPQPLLAVLRRLVNADTAVHRVLDPADPMFEYLAWPVSTDSPKADGDSAIARVVEAERIRNLQAVVGAPDIVPDRAVERE
jgi:hypothetical protein